MKANKPMRGQEVLNEEEKTSTKRVTMTWLHIFKSLNNKNN
jgi:hypothetical protein